MGVILALNFFLVTPASAETMTSLISRYSALYGVNASHLHKTLMCESALKPGAIGDHGKSFGIAQIHLPSHPQITKAQALDPDFSIRFAAKMFATGHANLWSCWRKLYA